MANRDIGRKATVFMQKVQVLKAEWFYRPIFNNSNKVLVVSANTRANYWKDKFEKIKFDAQLECYKNYSPKRLLGILK